MIISHGVKSYGSNTNKSFSECLRAIADWWDSENNKYIIDIYGESPTIAWRSMDNGHLGVVIGCSVADK